jgi:chromosome segregation ATPase
MSEKQKFPMQVQIELAPETKELIAQCDQVVPQITIDSAESCQVAASELAKVKAIDKSLESCRTEMKKPALEAGRMIDAFFKPYQSQLKNAETSIKNGISAYQREEQRKQAEKQRILDEQARKERERIEREAQRAREKAEAEQRELERIQLEKQKLAESQAPEAVAQLATLEKQESKVAAKIEKQELKAEQSESLAQSIVAPVVQTEAPKIAGLSSREVWSAEVTDIKALCRAVADGMVSVNAVEANMSYLNKLAKMDKDQMSIPGAKAVKETSIASRASEF